MLKNSIPQRRCIGCMKSTDQNQLIRMTYSQGEILIDEKEKSPGRGIYLCKNIKCFDSALKKKAFSRATRTNIKEENLKELRASIERIIDAGNQQYS